MDAELLKLLGPYGFGGIIVWMLWRFLSRLTDRGIGAFDKLTDTVAEHTKVDLAHHGEVKESLVEVSTKVDLLFELTPPPQPAPRRRTHPQGVPAGYYGPRKPTNGDDDHE